MGMTALLVSGIAASAVSAATQLGGSIASPILQNQANNKQFQQQKALMDYQNQLQMETWQKQQSQINEYNSPANQIKRLTEAGINPNFMGDVQGNYSSVSPEASIGLGSTNPQSLMPDLSGFQNIAKSLFEGAGLDIKQKEFEVNKKMAESSIAVQSQTVENLIKQKEKTDAEINEIKTRTAAITEELQIKYRSLQQNLFDLKIKALRFGLDHARNAWEREVGLRNAATGESNARTNAYNSHIAKETLKERSRQFDASYEKDKKQFSSLMRQNNLDKLFKIIDYNSITTPFGVITDIPSVTKSIGLIEAWNASLSDMTDLTKVKLAPLISTVEDALKNTEITAKKYNYKAPWQKDSPYLNYKNVSDGF